MRQAARDEVEQGEDLDLLWPPGQGSGGVGLGERVVQDLELETLIQALAIGGKREDQELIRSVLLDLCRDPEAIRYRQAICGDLVRSEALAEGIEGLLPRLDQLNVYSMGDPDMPELFQVAWWLRGVGDLRRLYQGHGSGLCGGQAPAQVGRAMRAARPGGPDRSTRQLSDLGAGASTPAGPYSRRDEHHDRGQPRPGSATGCSHIAVTQR